MNIIHLKRLSLNINKILPKFNMFKFSTSFLKEAYGLNKPKINKSSPKKEMFYGK
jgi:hypothetical protein